MRMIYFSVMLENLSIFYYKCIDPFYILESYISSHDTNQPIDKDFWIKSEDLLMRQKSNFTISQLSRLAIIYSGINQGSNVFW